MMKRSASASATTRACAACAGVMTGAAGAAGAAFAFCGAAFVSAAASCNNGVFEAKRIFALEPADEANKCRFVRGRQCLEVRTCRSGLAVMPCHGFRDVSGARIVQQAAHSQGRCDIPEGRGAPFAGSGGTFPDAVIESWTHLMKEQIRVGGYRRSFRVRQRRMTRRA